MDSKKAIPDFNPAQAEIRPPQQSFVVFMEYGPYPVQLACPYCYAQILTRTQYEAGLASWMLCIFVAWCALCCNFTKDVHHYCPACNKWIGRYRRGCTRQIITLVVAVFGASFILGFVIGILRVLNYNRTLI